MAKEFFQMLPTVNYAFDSSQIINIKHIFRRFKFIESVKENIRSYDTYKILDGEAPDTVAYKFYGDSKKHWIILLFNDIIDPFGQWPMSHEELRKYVISKYGIDNIYAVTHHVNSLGQTVDLAYYKGILNSDGTYTQDAIPITNYDWEENINDSKRKIYIPHAQYISKIISEIEDLI